jgi:hypothetical protein
MAFPIFLYLPFHTTPDYILRLAIYKCNGESNPEQNQTKNIRERKDSQILGEGTKNSTVTFHIAFHSQHHDTPLTTQRGTTLKTIMKLKFLPLEIYFKVWKWTNYLLPQNNKLDTTLYKLSKHLT